LASTARRCLKAGLLCRLAAILDGRLLAHRRWWEIRVKTTRFTRSEILEFFAARWQRYHQSRSLKAAWQGIRYGIPMESIVELIRCIFFYFYAVLLVINVCCSYGAVLAIVWVYTYLRLICACLAFVFGIYLAVLLLRARHRYFSDPTGLKSPG
jgi:hypothetical protein